MRDPSGKTFITEQQAIAGAVAAPTFGYTPYKTGRRVVELGVKYAYLEVEPHSLGSSARLVHNSHRIEMRGESMRHAQRARSEPLQNQAHSFGSVPRQCPSASWLQTDDLTIEFFSSCGASSQTGGKP